MKKAVITSIIILFCSTQAMNSQNFIVFNLNDLEGWNIAKNVGFISLSEVYASADTNANALFVIPDSSKITKEEIQYFKLNSECRKKFLSQSSFSETDTVFIYDYSTDVLTSFGVKDLKIVACLNPYMLPEDCHTRNYTCTDYDYMIGFEINKTFLNGFSPYYRNALVYVGKENPFVRGQMKAVFWKKIDSNNLPSVQTDVKIDSIVQWYMKGDIYAFKSGEFQYFIQNLLCVNNISNNIYTCARHLLIVNVKNGIVVAEKVFKYSESTSLAPLNFVEADYDYGEEQIIQWTGYLFKNKHPVIFGFEYFSFGCPYIMFLNPLENDIYINCDNRH